MTDQPFHKTAKRIDQLRNSLSRVAPPQHEQIINDPELVKKLKYWSKHLTEMAAVLDNLRGTAEQYDNACGQLQGYNYNRMRSKDTYPFEAPRWYVEDEAPTAV